MLRACGAALLGHASVGGAVLGAVRMFSASSAAQEAAKIGFIGLGRMGSRMVPRLLDAGHEVVLHDSNKLAVSRMKEIGEAHSKGKMTVCYTPAQVASTQGVNVLFTVLPDPSALNTVFLGPEGLLHAPHGLHPSLFINVSTVDPDTARRLAKEVHSRKLAAGAQALTKSGRPEFLDAPATGGIVGAEAGELCFSVGTKEVADLEAAKPYLMMLGNHVTHCGPVGAGSVAKLCNTLVMGATMAAVSEALALGKRLHLDPAILTDVLNSGSGHCWASEKYNPVPGIVKGAPANNGYKAGQEVDQVREQLLMLINAGQKVHSPTPMAKFTEELYRVMHDEGLGGKDFSAVYRYRYGSGCDMEDWREGDRLFSSQIP